MKNQKRTMTVRGVFLRPASDLFLECDDPRRTLGPNPKPSRGCALPFYPKEGGKSPHIEVFLPLGDERQHLKPVSKRFSWQKDIHVITDDGETAEPGDIVELTGELDTSYGNCDLSKVSSVKLVEDKY